ncbi:MAG: hypothetical protein MUO31_03790, partial [Thermodesulfovibrionales bacterium]|nr:hypothetical protein [Thermodesulfovibrionales bacterium]
VNVTPTQDTTYSITVTGPGGTAMASVTVKMLAGHLQSVWDGMKTAMLNSDIDQAVSNFYEGTREKYREVYAALSTQLPQIAQEIGEMEFLAYKENMAIFRIKRNDIINGEEQEISYRVYFVYQNGKWLIYKY